MELTEINCKVNKDLHQPLRDRVVDGDQGKADEGEDDAAAGHWLSNPLATTVVLRRNYCPINKHCMPRMNGVEIGVDNSNLMCAAWGYFSKSDGVEQAERERNGR